MKVLIIVIAVIGSIVIGFFSLGLITPNFTYTTEVEINKPVARVYDVFTNPDNTAKWLKGFLRFEPIEGVPMTVGSKFRMILNNNGEIVTIIETMTAIEENKRFAFDLESDVHVGHTEITFIALDSETTLVRSTNDVEAKTALMRSIFVIMKSYFQTVSDKQFATIKKLSESHDAQ